MMPDIPLKLARGLTLYGGHLEEEVMDRSSFLERIDVKDSIYRHWIGELGDGGRDGSGLRFFGTDPGPLCFGPGAGLVLGVSLGTTSLHAALIDANGRRHHSHYAPTRANQLSLSPEKIFSRIQEAATDVLEPALEDEALLVHGALRFRGIAVACPSPLNRAKLPVGHALAHRDWRSNTSLPERLARHLDIDSSLCHAVNDAWAAAIGVAFDRTRDPDASGQEDPELTIVARLAGGVGGASIIIEPPQGRREDRAGRVSGFAKSILIAGVDAHAGEIGHINVPASTVAERNKRRPDDLRALRAVRCSCSPPDATVPRHLEAFASRAALAQRIDPARQERQVINRVLADPQDPAHRYALEDVGILTADCLLGSVSTLNPARIVLTGSLANDVVRKAMDKRLEDRYRFITHPTVACLSGEENDFIRARGAALAVIRRQIFRQLPLLLGGRSNVIPRQLADRTRDLTALPW